jgi:dihydrofolate reductase
MGRKTWESLPGPLPGRENWVISSKLQPISGIKVFKSLSDAYESAKNRAMFIIGGGELYRQTLPNCQELYVSEVHRVVQDGDVFFPSFKDDYELKENLFKNREFTLNRWIKKTS